MKKRFLYTSLSGLLLPFAGMAHPGHGETGGFTIIHYFTEPVHAIFSIGLVVATVLYIRLQDKKRQAQEKR
jgi:hypothetical protein